MGPLARSTAEAMSQRLLRDLEQGRGGPPYLDELLALRAAARERSAHLINVPAENVALTTSTTDGCNIVLAGLGLAPEDEVVTTDSEHFGLLGPLQASGARLRIARLGDRPPEEAFDLIHAEIGPRTRLIALSHVTWTTGSLLPVEELKDTTGLPVLVDGAQSAGAIPVDASRFDYYTVSGQKWLCGPEATGALYVRDPESLRVASPTYFSQKTYSFDEAFVVREGAARFDSGWVPLGALAGFIDAIDLAPEWRYARVAEMAATCFALLAEAGQDVVTAPGQAGLVAIRLADAAAAVARAYERDVVVREIPGLGLLRVSCGWWTSDDDLRRLVDSLQA
jgi:L-cysteine/cystine lyase